MTDNKKDTSFIIFDVETTGTDQGKDQILEFSVKYGLSPDSPEDTWRIRPLVAIDPGAEEVHGISMEDVKNCPTFRELGKKIYKIMSDATYWCGYNVDFDVNILQAEFKRNGFPNIDMADKVVIDPYKLWQKKETRKLEDAYRVFVGKELAGAHAASVDTSATGEVLIAMLEKYDMMDCTLEDIALECNPDRAMWIGPSKHFQWNEAGEVIIAFGNKHGGQLLEDMASDKDGRSYLNWIYKADFPAHVRDIAYEVLQRDPENLKEWLISSYGPPPNNT